MHGVAMAFTLLSKCWWAFSRLPFMYLRTPTIVGVTVGIIIIVITDVLYIK